MRHKTTFDTASILLTGTFLLCITNIYKSPGNGNTGRVFKVRQKINSALCCNVSRFLYLSRKSCLPNGIRRGNGKIVGVAAFCTEILNILLFLHIKLSVMRIIYLPFLFVLLTVTSCSKKEKEPLAPVEDTTIQNPPSINNSGSNSNNKILAGNWDWLLSYIDHSPFIFTPENTFGTRKKMTFYDDFRYKSVTYGSSVNPSSADSGTYRIVDTLIRGKQVVGVYFNESLQRYKIFHQIDLTANGDSLYLFVEGNGGDRYKRAQ